MKIDKNDAHDRYRHFTSSQFDIGECCQSLLNSRPFGDRPFYIFAHPRTEEDGVTKRLIWQPRLTKPRAQTNSMLFKGDPRSDIVRIIWMIPAPELWDSFRRGKLTENKLIWESIDMYTRNKKKLEAKEPDDLSDEEIDKIYKEISTQARQRSLGAF